MLKPEIIIAIIISGLSMSFVKTFTASFSSDHRPHPVCTTQSFPDTVKTLDPDLEIRRWSFDFIAAPYAQPLIRSRTATSVRRILVIW